MDEETLSSLLHFSQMEGAIGADKHRQRQHLFMTLIWMWSSKFSLPETAPFEEHSAHVPSQSYTWYRKCGWHCFAIFQTTVPYHIGPMVWERLRLTC